MKRTFAIIALTLSILLLFCGCGLEFLRANEGEAENDDTFTYTGILPNTSIGNVDVSGLDKDQAKAKVTSSAEANFQPYSVTVLVDGQGVTFCPVQSVSVDNLDSLVDAAYNNGRTGSDRADYEAALQTSFQVPMTTSVTIDYTSLRSQVDELAEAFNTQCSMYSMAVSKEDKTVTITKGADGRDIRADELYAKLLNCFETGDTEGFAWTSDFIKANQTDMSDDAVLAQSITTDWEELTVEPQDAYYDSETQELVPEVVGMTFDLEEAIEKAQLAEAGSSFIIELVVTEPEITSENMPQQLFFDLLGSCDSTLDGSTEGRKVNLTLVCEAIDGTILQPGDVFSFNDIVGERTAEKGYKPAGVYIGGQTQDQLGGGICQAASTIYLASLRANLEIVERYPHDYLVTYVPMGCDATIYWGTYDYRFRNSTDFPMKMHTWVADGYVHVELWGTNVTGEYAEMTYEVLSTTPYGYVTEEDDTKEVGYSKITTYPYTGYSVNTYRNVYDKDGNLLSTTFEARTDYKVRNQVTTIGTMGAEPEPAPEPEAPASTTETTDTPPEDTGGGLEIVGAEPVPVG